MLRQVSKKYNHATNRPRNADAKQPQSLSNLREFPPRPASNGASPINARPYLQQVEKNLPKMMSLKPALNFMKIAAMLC